jgi:hypothetical protein
MNRLQVFIGLNYDKPEFEDPLKNKIENWLMRLGCDKGSILYRSGIKSCAALGWTRRMDNTNTEWKKVPLEINKDPMISTFYLWVDAQPPLHLIYLDKINLNVKFITPQLMEDLMKDLS